jgi:SAM-dependent methyltransferase
VAAENADRCVACGSERLRPRFAVGGDAGAEGLIPTTKQFGTALADIVRCERCGHMQLDHFPPDDELVALYSHAESDDYVDEEAGQRESARRVLREVERHTRPGPLLDVGCWVGFLMAEARERGWDPLGVEPSAFAARYARDRLGLEVIEGDFFSAEFPGQRFNAVVMGDVLEHLTRAGAALDRVKELLAPDGVLVLQVPDAGSLVARALGRRWWSVIPTHVHYFTRASIAALLAGHGFDPVHVGTDPKAFTVGYYLDKGGGYAPGLARRLVRGAERVGLADRMWAPDFRDRMLVVARPSRA